MADGIREALPGSMGREGVQGGEKSAGIGQFLPIQILASANIKSHFFPLFISPVILPFYEILFSS